jgi:lipopolysaccharide biosynthesis regulator YciM
MLGRQEEAETLVRRNFDRHPDYFFARTGMAQFEVRQGHTDAAVELLKPLFSQKRLHLSEFKALCRAYVELTLAEKNTPAARSWLKMWQSADPDDAELLLYHAKLAGTGLRERFSRRLR